MKLQISDLIGAEIAPHIDRLAQLRMDVFREYPYLYEGTMEYEQNYLRKLAESPHGYVVIARDGEEIVGASTALPLTDAQEDLHRPFLEQELDIERYFYLGESILLPEYRGSGHGRIFFDEREAQAQFLAFPEVCFCAVVRPENHPQRPADYRPLEKFWRRRGYHHRPELQTALSWTEIGQANESAHPMQFWTKPVREPVD